MWSFSLGSGCAVFFDLGTWIAFFQSLSICPDCWSFHRFGEGRGCQDPRCSSRRTFRNMTARVLADGTWCGHAVPQPQRRSRGPYHGMRRMHLSLPSVSLALIPYECAIHGTTFLSPSLRAESEQKARPGPRPQVGQLQLRNKGRRRTPPGSRREHSDSPSQMIGEPLILWSQVRCFPRV